MAGLHDMAGLVPVLKALAARHAEYNLEPQHFPPVGQALLFALEQVPPFFFVIYFVPRVE